MFLYMKKFLIFTILLVCILSANAQIQTELLGLRLGKTTKEQAINILKSKKCNYEWVNQSDLWADYLWFAGYQWATVGFRFYENKLKMIVFQTNDYDYKKEAIIQQYGYLSQKLLNKYSSYLISKQGGKLIFDDNHTSLTIEYAPHSTNKDSRTMFLSLIYLDNNLNNKSYNSDNEL